MNYQDRLNTCKKEGLKAEDVFAKLMKQKGYTWRKANRQEDIFHHIDCYVNNKSVDVKGNRHEDCIWLELTNVNGELGWLKGKAMFIAFDIQELGGFSIYKRSDLLNYCSKFSERTTNKHDFYKIYTRAKFGRKDEIIKVKYKDIKDLELNLFKYEI